MSQHLNDSFNDCNLLILLRCESKKTLRFSDIFPKQLGFFSPNFTCLLYVPIYARQQIFYSINSNYDEVLPPPSLGNNVRKPQGGIFFDTHCRYERETHTAVIITVQRLRDVT